LSSQRRSFKTDILRLGPVVALAIVVTGCGRNAASAERSNPAAVHERYLAVLPNNTAIYGRGERVVAVRREGEILWEGAIPSGDALIAPIAVALNSTAYLRGKKALHLVGSDGKWLWSRPLDGEAAGKNPEVNAPTTFPDSTAAVVVGDDILRFDSKGVVLWRFSLPEGHVVAHPRAGMDGALFVQSSAGMYCLSPEGNVSWMRAIGN